MKPLAIVAAGAITPVGLRAVETAFAWRASMAAMREAPLVDDDGEPITMCFLPTLAPLLTGAERVLELASSALAEAAEDLGPAARTARARVVLVADEDLGVKTAPGRSPAAWLASELAARARSLFADVSVDVVARGPAGAGRVLPDLEGALATGSIDIALLGGAHSDYDPRRIAELAGAGRLFRSDRLDALIPGEAAAFVALVRPDVARRLRLAERTRIVAVASAQEQARPDNDASAFAALGLTAALRAALASLGDEEARVGWMLTDLSFETFRHFELQAATLRTQSFFCDPQRVDSPAQRMGHLGAAAMPLHLVLASEAFRRGFAPHPRALSIAGSDGGERAVMLLLGLA